MVLVFSENKKNGSELLAKARELADAKGGKVTAFILERDSGDADDLIRQGADRVVISGKGLQTAKAEEVSDILAAIVKEDGEQIVILSSTKHGKEIAPRLAALLDAGSTTDSTKLYYEGSDLISERVVYSGNAVAVEKFSSFPAVITIPAKAYDPLPRDDGRTGEVLSKDISPGEYASKVVNVQKMLSEGVNVEDAEVIVSCGRGFKNSDDLKLIEELAELLNGNALGCSRPIAADLKWLSEDHWIGLSGHKVKPKLYFACGISGQIQHVAGMRDSGIIVAINKDPDAPIFKSADYGIVGDLYTVLPKLIGAIKDKL